MSRMSRRSFVAGSAAATAVVSVNILPGRARAAEFSMKYANNTVDTHPMTIRMREAVAKIKDETKGRVEIEVFPNSQLGGDTDMLSQLRTGAIDFFTLSGLILATLVPVASINGIGFAFKSYDQVWPAMDGELGAHVRGGIGKAGLVAIDKMWDNGYRQITSSTHPINTPEDFKGFKIRVPVSPALDLDVQGIRRLPRQHQFQRGLFGAADQDRRGPGESGLADPIAKLYEVQKYCSMTNHMWDGFWFLANRQELPRCRRISRTSSRARSTRRRSRTGPISRAQRHGGGRPQGQGHDLRLPTRRRSGRR